MADSGNLVVSGAMWVFFLTGIAGSIPIGGLDVCLL